MKKLFASKLDPSLQGKEYVINRRKVILEDVIAEGGFSIVFLVSCEAEGTKYALKRMFVNDKESFDQCMREIDISMKLSGHRNVVRIVDTSISQATNGVSEVLILMHFYPGSILAEMTQRSCFSEDEVLRMFTDVCEAVAAMHSLEPPVVHRDLKVENLLRDSLGNCVLCDFGSAATPVIEPQSHGFARVVEEIQKHTTPAYRSPEMVDVYANKPITAKSDVWALGCLLYRLCFFTSCFGDSALAITSGNFTVPDDHRYSQDLMKLIRYMLEVDVDSRPDIFQVCHVAFKISNRRCPIPNRNNLPLPNISNLPLPQTESNARLSRPATIKISDPPDQASGTSINPRERPRAQATNRLQGFNLNPTGAGSTTVQSAPQPYERTPAAAEAGAKQTNPFLVQEAEVAPKSDEAPLIDFQNPTPFEDFFVPGLPPIRPAGRSAGRSAAAPNATPPFGIPHRMPGASWNPFVFHGVAPRGTGFQAHNSTFSTLPDLSTARWRCQMPLSVSTTHSTGRHRRNVSDTSALVPPSSSAAGGQAFQAFDNLDNINESNNFASVGGPPTWSHQQRHHLQSHYSSARQLQQSTNDSTAASSVFGPFENLSLGPSHPATLGQSASLLSLTDRTRTDRHGFTSSTSLTSEQGAGVDAFGAIPFHSMVSEYKKHSEMCHKRSISEI